MSAGAMNYIELTHAIYHDHEQEYAISSPPCSPLSSITDSNSDHPTLINPLPSIENKYQVRSNTLIHSKPVCMYHVSYCYYMYQY